MIRQHDRRKHAAGVSACLLALLLAALPVAPVAANPGDVDPLFGDNGFAVKDLHEQEGFIGVDTDVNGDIVAAGYTLPSGGSSRIVVARYTADGQLDPSFSGDGIVETRFGYPDAMAFDVAIDSSGRVVVVGATGTPLDILVGRLRKDGAIDTTFGSGGSIRIDKSGIGQADQLRGVDIDPSGKIAVAGYANNIGGFKDVLVGQLMPSGMPDSGFGTGGFTIQSISGHSGAYDVKYDPIVTGHIIVAGTATYGNSNLMLARFTPGGGLDNTFGTAGVAQIDAGGPFESYSTLDVSQSGQILAGGYSDASSVTHGVVGFYNPGGTFNSGFNGGAPVDLPYPGTNYAEITDIAFGPGGSFVGVAGLTASGGGPRLGTLEMQGDGSVQSAGIVPTQIPMSVDALGLLPDGQMIAAGAQDPGGFLSDLALVGLQGGCVNTYTYSGPDGGNWSVPSNWSPPGVPTFSGDCAMVNNQHVEMDGTVTLTKAMLGPGGEIGGDGTLRVRSLLEVHGGTLGGDTQTRILPGASLEIDGLARLGGCVPPGPVCAENHTIINDGKTVLLPGGSLQADDGVSFTNNGKLDIQGDGGFWHGQADGDGPAVFVNNGVIVKSAEQTPGIPSIIEGNFTNNGQIHILVGDLQIWTTKKLNGMVAPGLDMSTGTTLDTLFPDGLHHRDFATWLRNLSPDDAQVSVNEGGEPSGSPRGYDFFDFSTQVLVQDEPDGIPADLRFAVDSSLLDGRQLLVFDHGVLVPECPDAFTIDPDPCVVITSNIEGDAVFIIRSEHMGRYSSGKGRVSKGGVDALAPVPLPHAKKDPISVEASAAEADPLEVSVDAADVLPEMLSGGVGLVLEYTVTGGATATDEMMLAGNGTPEPLYEDATDGAYRYPAGTFTVSNGAVETTSVSLTPLAQRLSKTSGDIAVVWSATAAVPNCGPCRYDAQVKAKVKGNKATGWKNFLNDTNQASGVYIATKPGSYQFRARLVNPQTGANSGWSPATPVVKT